MKKVWCSFVGLFSLLLLVSCDKTPQRICFIEEENSFEDSSVIVHWDKEEEYFTVLCKTDRDNKTFDFRLFVNSEEISGLTYYNKTKNEYFEFKYNENYFSKDSEFVISYSNVLNDIKIQINEENYSLYVFDTEWFPKPITL
jgi:hypothetical protein